MTEYNEQDHLKVERWGGKNRSKRNRYLIRKYRRLRKLGDLGKGIPADLPDTGGEAVTKIEGTKAVNLAIVISNPWND